MPTVISHTAVPLALGLGLGSRLIPPRLLLAGVVASMLPDLDVVGFKLGIAYANDMGHRGITHSVLFALVAGLFAHYFSPLLKAPPRRAGLFVSAACMSHGILDMLTNGGLGIAFLWPFSHERYFMPWQPIEVSPLALDRVLGARGQVVLLSELKWVWLPCILLGMALAVAHLGVRRLKPT